MISQSTLKPARGSRRKKRLLGRGDASGHGSFSTRGSKGQSSRSGGGTKPGFEGGQTPLIRRLPKVRGFKNPNRVPFQVVNVGDLEKLEAGSTVDLVVLFERGLVSKKNLPVKLLAGGELSKKFTIKVDSASQAAVEKVEKHGGKVVVSKQASEESK